MRNEADCRYRNIEKNAVRFDYSTLEEVLKIQEEGRTKRTEAESELYQMEKDLKTKLLDMK